MGRPSPARRTWKRMRGWGRGWGQPGLRRAWRDRGGKGRDGAEQGGEKNADLSLPRKVCWHPLGREKELRAQPGAGRLLVHPPPRGPSGS